jgi:hypothetical protein
MHRIYHIDSYHHQGKGDGKHRDFSRTRTRHRGDGVWHQDGNGYGLRLHDLFSDLTQVFTVKHLIVLAAVQRRIEDVLA